jgi:DNA repair protein RadC
MPVRNIFIMSSQKYGMHVKLKDLPKEERPRERIMRFGPSALSNHELIAAILGTGNRKETVTDVARKVLVKHSMEDLSQVTAAELRGFGINNAKACQLIAAVELGKRVVSNRAGRKKKIKTACDIAKIFMPEMRGLKKEVLKCIFMDSKLSLLNEGTISVGGLNTNSIEAREVFRQAILEAASAIILVHNHPSGDPEPSAKDVETTKRLARAGRLIGIPVLDHIVIGSSRYTSMKETGLF